MQDFAVGCIVLNKRARPNKRSLLFMIANFKELRKNISRKSSNRLLIFFLKVLTWMTLVCLLFFLCPLSRNDGKSFASILAPFDFWWSSWHGFSGICDLEKIHLRKFDQKWSQTRLPWECRLHCAWKQKPCQERSWWTLISFFVNVILLYLLSLRMSTVNFAQNGKIWRRNRWKICL